MGIHGVSGSCSGSNPNLIKSSSDTDRSAEYDPPDPPALRSVSSVYALGATPASSMRRAIASAFCAKDPDAHAALNRQLNVSAPTSPLRATWDSNRRDASPKSRSCAHANSAQLSVTHTRRKRLSISSASARAPRRPRASPRDSSRRCFSRYWYPSRPSASGTDPARACASPACTCTRPGPRERVATAETPSSRQTPEATRARASSPSRTWTCTRRRSRACPRGKTSTPLSRAPVRAPPQTHTQIPIPAPIRRRRRLSLARPRRNHRRLRPRRRRERTRNLRRRRAPRSRGVPNPTHARSARGAHQRARERRVAHRRFPADSRGFTRRPTLPNRPNRRRPCTPSPPVAIVWRTR